MKRFVRLLMTGSIWAGILASPGATTIADPDVVLFDAAGTISGIPGSVLVGGLNAKPPDAGSITRIAPDGSVSALFGPTTAYRPTRPSTTTGGSLTCAAVQVTGC